MSTSEVGNHLLTSLTRFIFLPCLLFAVLNTPLAPYAHATEPVKEPITTSTPLFIDFLQYWCGARILLDGGNPYDPEQQFEMQRTLLPALQEPILQWNPPTIFFFSLPFALVPFHIAELLWIGASILLLAFSWLILFRALATGSHSPRHATLPLLATLLFFPFWESLRFGQVSPLLLAGFSCFLVHRAGGRSAATYQFIAGLGLSVTLVKPHLLFLIYALLILEALRMKRLATLGGLLLGASLLSLTACLFKADIWSAYFHALGEWPIYFQTPTLGSWLQSLTSMNPVARFIPSLVAGLLLWLVSLRGRNRGPFSLITIVAVACFSLFTSPYGWSFDHVLLLPALFLLVNMAPWGAIAVLAANALGFPWYGETPMENLVWYPPLIGILLVYFYRKNFFEPWSVGPTP